MNLFSERIEQGQIDGQQGSGALDMLRCACGRDRWPCVLAGDAAARIA